MWPRLSLESQWSDWPRKAIPYMVMFFIALLLITYIPAISLVLL